jgi:ABC-type multidrug transport system fused ATPase/permease subunit
MRSNRFSKYALDVFRFIGTTGFVWMGLGIIGALLLAAVELGIAYIIPMFFKAVGITEVKVSMPSFLSTIEISAPMIGAALIGLGTFRFLGQYLVNQSGYAVQEELNFRLRKLLIFRILLHPNQSFQSASQSNHLMGAIFPSASIALHHITVSMSQALQSLALVAIMLMISWQEAIVGISGLLGIGILVKSINRAIARRAAIIPLENKQLTNGFERVARNWLLVRVLKTQNLEYQRFAKSITTIHSHTLKTASLSNMAGSATPFLGIILLTFIVFISRTFWSTPGGVLISFLYVFIRFVQMLAGAVNSATQIGRYLPQLKESFDYSMKFSESYQAAVLQHEPTEVQTESNISIQSGTNGDSAPSIEFHCVSFYYDHCAILKDVSFIISAGKTVGIMGPSGSGKSTLLLLLLGALKPSHGKILVNNEPADRLLKYHANIGYVGPEPFLFEGTVRENLCYGIYNTQEADLWKALQQAKLDEAIRAMPGKLDHWISENGEGLSAGQKQRLCLARVFLKSPPLIILDEATANLDVKTEAEVIDSLANQKNEATIVIVTHRSSTLRHADHIYDMEKGEFRQTVRDISGRPLRESAAVSH